MSRLSKCFWTLITICIHSGLCAQKYLFSADSCKADNFPVVEGRIYHRGYGNTVLSKEQLEIYEDGKPVNFELKPFVSRARELPKNKRVLFLVENHYQSRGTRQRSFFANVISTGIYNSVIPGDKFMIATFDWHRNGRYIFPAFKNFTDDTAVLRYALRGLTAPPGLHNKQEGSDINSSLNESIKFLSPVSDSLPATIVLFSDDLDNSVEKIANLDIRNKAIEAKIPIYAISYAMYSRYNAIMRDEICTPTFGKYFISPTNDIAVSGNALKDFLDEMINDYKGSSFLFSYTSLQKKKEQKLNLEFRIKNSPVKETKIVATPVLSLKEKIANNPGGMAAIAGGVLVFIAILVYFFRKTRLKQKKQEEALNKTRQDLTAQVELTEQEKAKTDAQIQAIQLQQVNKERERAADETRKQEEQKLVQLMLARGVFPTLNYTFGDSTGRVDVSSPVFTIGRDKTNSFYIQLDTVSRKHATIFFDESGTYTIIDHGSSNGTFVNGEKIKQIVLKNNDLVQIGGVNIIFYN